ncbi:EAL domain-containing protein [Clostridium sp. PL3]|uniref:EAL domain-containing protein n=1 Tax=Clostridium thailandense TaxID=2794346 RepID=A0A949TZQ6_9CLOT|nr:ABC transporter substrate binding protein [Clostridium thailandense]MBV7274630.1 EAL domain-containing protein [Clostridium thailandense]
MIRKIPMRYLLAVCLILFIGLYSRIYVKAASQERILILHSYSDDFRWTMDIDTGIKSVLNIDSRLIDLSHIYMDTKRIQTESYIDGLFNLLKIRFANSKFDVIICSDNDALDFLVKYGSSLFPNTPVVFCGINNFSYSMLEGHKNFTGICETIDIESTLKSIPKLQTNIKNIILVCDSSSTGKLNEELAKKAISKLKLPVKFYFYCDTDVKTLVSAAKELGNDTAIFHVGQLRDTDGSLISYEKIGPLLSKDLNIGNYICWSFAIGNGILGGKALNSVDHGKTAASMALKILHGKKVSDIPIIEQSPSNYVFDYSELQKLKIDKRNIPENSIIINKPFLIYKVYPKIFFTVLTIIISLLLFVIILFINIKKRKLSEKKLIENYEELNMVYQELYATEEELEFQYIELQKSENFLKLSEKKYKHLAYYDNLTVLPNRTSFVDKLNQSICKYNETGEKGAVLFIDLDNFKRINDTLGHDYGDKLLKKAASKLIASVNRDNFVYRIGGDEFLILLVNIENKDNVVQACRKILKAFKTPFKIDEKKIFTTVSIGVSLYPDDGLDCNLLLKNADTAMYKAKDLGKNRYEFYDTKMFDEISKKSEIEKGLRAALNEGGFQLYYQPQIDCKTRKIKGMEALLRWQSEDYGLVSPAEFIPVAEETSLIIPIGYWVLKTACYQGKKWIDAGYNLGTMSINVSIIQLQHSNFINAVKRTLAKSNFPPNLLEIEITESVLMQSVDSNIKILNELKALGVSIALDDFGTGYSSLNYLKILPINNLKIDKSFIDSIHTSTRDRDVIDGMIQLANKMNLNVIAEGVEWQEQFDILHSLNCQLIQGYFFSKPIPADKVEKLENIWTSTADT